MAQVQQVLHQICSQNLLLQVGLTGYVQMIIIFNTRIIRLVKNNTLLLINRGSNWSAVSYCIARFSLVLRIPLKIDEVFLILSCGDLFYVV